MAAELFYLPFTPAFDANGIIVPGAKLYFYVTGTTTPQAIYSNSGLTTPLTNPVEANAAGVWPAIYMDDSLVYRVVLKTSLGATLNDVDPYYPGTVGGNIIIGSEPVIGLFSALGSLDAIPVGIDRISTTGHTVLGKGAAVYIRDGTATWSAAGTALRTAAIAAGVASATVDAALLATESKFRKADAGGAYWTLSKDQEVTDLMFGALRDATYNAAAAWNARWSGTDDRAAAQAMIDWALYFGGSLEISWGNGTSLWGATVHIGYGHSFTNSLSIVGKGFCYDPSDIARGTAFVRNFVGQPLMNIQGARGVILDKFTAFGVHYKYFATNYFASIVNANLVTDDTNGANWYDPTIQTALGRAVDYRYAPDAAITIDAYSGTRPGSAWTAAAAVVVGEIRSNGGNYYRVTVAGTTAGSGGPSGTGGAIADNTATWAYVSAVSGAALHSYPDASYPAWISTAYTTQWGKGVSSNVSIFPTAGNFLGEINGLVTHPSGSDGNGDFITIGRVEARYCKRVASYSQTQCRSAPISYLSAGQIYEVFTTSAHGQQTGQVDACFNHISVSGVVQTCSIGSTAFSGPVTFQQGYFEGLYRLLDIEGSSTGESILDFNQTKVTFDLQGPLRGIPAYMIRCPALGFANAPVEIRGGKFNGYRAFTSQAPLTFTNGAKLESTIAGSAPTTINGAAGVVTAPLAMWHNATCGGAVPLFGAPGRWSSRAVLRNVDTQAIVQDQQFADGMRFNDRRYGIPLYVNYVQTNYTNSDGLLAGTELVPNPVAHTPYTDSTAWVQIDKSAIVTTSVSSGPNGYEWTFTYPGTAAQAEVFGLAAGDMLYDGLAGQSGIVFVVRSFVRGTGVVIAVALTGVAKSGANWAPITAFNQQAGVLYVRNCRRFTPNKPLFGDFAAASAALTNVGQRDGSDVDAATIAIGDYLDSSTTAENLLANTAAARITAFDNAANTLSFTGNAARTVAAQPMRRFFRTVANA